MRTRTGYTRSASVIEYTSEIQLEDRLFHEICESARANPRLYKPITLVSRRVLVRYGDDARMYVSAEFRRQEGN